MDRKTSFEFIKKLALSLKPREEWGQGSSEQITLLDIRLPRIGCKKEIGCKKSKLIKKSGMMTLDDFDKVLKKVFQDQYNSLSEEEKIERYKMSKFFEDAWEEIAKEKNTNKKENRFCRKVTFSVNQDYPSRLKQGCAKAVEAKGLYAHPFIDSLFNELLWEEGIKTGQKFEITLMKLD
jgi:hypothetical protein